MKVHAVVCSYLGDGELDIGKTAAWLNNFVDTTFFYALQYQDAALKYSIDYAATFPDALFAYHPMTPTGFFGDPALFRKAAFDAAKKAWNYDNNDWVIFIDGTESITVDVPFEQLELAPDSVLFKYLYDEVTAAGANTALAFPFYVFLNQGPVVEEFMAADLDLAHAITTERAALEAELATADPTRVVEINNALALLDETEDFNNSVLYWTCHPRYQDVPATRKLARMLKVSAAPTFNWTAMDNFSAAASLPATAAHTAIVSYSYARYVEGKPDPADWTEAEDIGFKNRLLVQSVRTVGLTQTYATADPAGTASAVPGKVLSPAYCYYIDQFDTGDGNPDFESWTALWRINPRDGVWYVHYELGPVPIDPLTGLPSVSPEQWAAQPPSTTGPPGTSQANP